MFSRTVLIIFFIFFCLNCDSNALKCRTGEEVQPNEDFEYVVRMCLRQMKNATRYENFDRNFGGMFESDKNRKDRNWMQNKNKNYNNRNPGDDGFEYFWNSNPGRDRDKDQKGDGGKMDNDYMEDSDYFHANPMRGMSTENRARVKQRPHTYQQQIQHDRDIYGYGNRDGYSSYSGERNKNTKRTSSRDRKGDSPLEQLDPCMIHCIFQEMQMLDENGKPDKNTVSEKMSQKIRNPELKSFIQDSVEECFEMIEEDSENGNNRYNRGRDYVCVWSKNFAICLEEKGKESCDDWNDPIKRNNTSNNKNQDEKNKNKNSKGANNNSNNRG